MKHKISKFQRKKLIIKAHKLLDHIADGSNHWRFKKLTPNELKR